VIWIEVLSRHGEVVARHRCAGPEIRIGRGYANDVVLDDPYVAPEHLRIARDESGTLVAEDMGTANGLSAGRRRTARLALDGNRVMRIGRTYLRLREADHPVAAARLAGRGARAWPAIVALAIAVIAIELAGVWRHETGEPRASAYLSPALTVTVAVLGWTAGWTLLGRVFAGAARLERHLLIALSALLAYSLYDEAASFLGYALASPLLEQVQYVAFWCAIAAASFLHLRTIGLFSRLVSGGVVIAILAAALTVQTVERAEQRTEGDRQDMVRRLAPPMLRLAPVQSGNAFFAAVEAMKSELDTARRETPPVPGHTAD
jgi:hypothetical protein